MSTRLTKYIREQIAERVLRHRFADEVRKLTNVRAAFALEVYNDIYSKGDRDRMDALPSGWLPTASEVSVQFGETGHAYVSVPFSGTFYGPMAACRNPDDKPERTERRVLSKHRLGCIKVYPATHKLAAKHAELERRFDGMKEQFAQAKQQTEAALNSASTVNKLVEAWPAVEPFARAFDAAPLKVPSVPTEKLNELLDLPVSEAA